MRELALRIIHGSNVLRIPLAALILVCASRTDLSAQNPIVTENALVGNFASEWDVTGAGDPTIQGYATDISVNRGQTINFKVKTDARAYRIDIYRLGYYSGRGARKVATINPSVTLPQSQPQCLADVTTKLFDCGNWSVSASWAIPSTATSGVYVARPVRTDTGGASHIIFVVRNDTSNSDLLFQTSDTTWQAYNNYGGGSLYGTDGNTPSGRCSKVSYNRPFNDRAKTDEGVSFVFATEYPMIRWLEANGYNVSYASGVDTERRGSAALIAHKVFMSVGHDEYWSGGQRANVEAARAAGVNLAFFSGNEVFWKTRYENSIAGPTTPYRTLVCYKETHDNAKTDPTSAWTGTWRDPRFSPPADGGRPENSLTGQLFTVNAYEYAPIQISALEGKLRFWRNTGLDALLDGQSAQLSTGVLGYEWDEIMDNGFQPPGQFRLSTTARSVTSYLQDLGTSYAPGFGTHSLSFYRHSSGALVFGAGTVRYSWGLDAIHDISPPPNPGPVADARLQQATVNLFADMGVQPATLQSGLAAATASTDTTAPTSVFLTQPLTVPAFTSLNIFGATVDAGGGRPAVVELSLDAGATWHPVTGATNWAATLVPSVVGPVTIKSRATDDSGRTETPGPGLNLVVTANSTRCTIWPPDAKPVNQDQPNPSPSLELGTRFKTDVNGWITALRFYKHQNNTGPHVGNLWTSNGSLLATVAFTNETASGWQEAKLAVPIPVTAGTRYVASYHLDSGHYSEDSYYFAGRGADRGPLHAPADIAAEPNGLYTYGPSAFPAKTWLSGNYWVDVVFTISLGPDVTPPVITAISPEYGVGKVSPLTSVSAQFNEALQSSTVSATSFILRDAQGSSVAAAVSYDPASQAVQLQPTTPLIAGATYTATIKGGLGGVSDLAGNYLASDFVWSFTSGLWSLWTLDTQPAFGEQANPSPSLELGVRFKSDASGWITALRFYKSPANTGVHTGSLWTSSGTLLANVTFTNESAFGWQEAQLPIPIAVTAGTRYVASYHLDSGHYFEDSYYFAGKSTDRGPLHAPADIVTEANGLYRYGASAFPNNTWLSGNYWVDVVFSSSSQPAAPIMVPPGGNFAASLPVSITSAVPGAAIYYTLNGSTPTTASARYLAPLVLASTTTVRAITVAPNQSVSPVTSATYTMASSQVAQPTFSVGGGTYSSAQSVSLTCATSGSQIYYTVDGSTPTTSSTRYLGPIGVSTPLTIKTIGVAAGLPNSGIASATYAFQAALPIFNPPPGPYSSAQSVAISAASPGARIYYTIDGTTPTTSSPLYSSPIAVSSNLTINALATVTGWSNSNVATAVYVFSIQSGTKPTAPSGLAATAASSTQVDLTWTDDSNNETSFKLERKIGAAGTYAQIATPAANATSFSDTALTAATTYFYRVRATNTAGDSAYSNEASATTPAAPILPAPWVDQDIGSTGVAGTASYSSGSFTVKGSGSDIWYIADAFNYVYQAISGNFEFVARVTSVQNTSSSAKAGLMVRENLTAESKNAFIAVTATDGITFQRRLVANGITTYTGGASASAPYWLRLVRSGNTITSYNSSDGLSWLQVGTDTLTMTNPLQIGLAVTAHNNAVLNQSVFTNVFLTVEPAAPSGLAAIASSSNQINLSWVDNSSNESGFKIERKTGASGTYSQIATVAAGVTTYNNTALTAGTTYYYRVRSTNSGGDSAYSNEANATTAASSGVPAAPATLTATPVSGSQINLSWSDVATETGFKIERKTGVSGTYGQIATTGASITTYSNTGLVAGATYYYRVRASNAVGDSPYSPEANATITLPSFRSASSSSATLGSLTINKPSGTIEGDVMVAAIAIRPSSATIAASGWTLVRRLDNSSGNTNSLAVYYKVAGASEPTNYSFATSANTGVTGGIQSFSGIDTTNPVDVEAGQNTSSSLSLTAPSVTTRYANDLLVTAHAFSSSAPFSPPPGMTEAFDIATNSSGASGEAIEGNYQLQSTFGATGTRTATASNDADTGNAHTLALKAK